MRTAIFWIVLLLVTTIVTVLLEKPLEPVFRRLGDFFNPPHGKWVLVLLYVIGLTVLVFGIRTRVPLMSWIGFGLTAAALISTLVVRDRIQAHGTSSGENRSSRG